MSDTNFFTLLTRPNYKTWSIYIVQIKYYIWLGFQYKLPFFSLQNSKTVKFSPFTNYIYIFLPTRYHLQDKLSSYLLSSKKTTHHKDALNSLNINQIVNLSSWFAHSPADRWNPNKAEKHNKYHTPVSRL